MTAPGTSGDLAADRRYQWALGALAERDFEAARDLFEQVCELAPDWAPARFGLAEALEALERPKQAIEHFEAALRLDPSDAAGAGLRLARLTGTTPDNAPQNYVKTLFDQYAGHFDRHLVEKLGYRGPQILFDAIFPRLRAQNFEHALDLGCGAGLAGEKFRDVAAKLTGVDLSPAMIFEAGKKKIYDRLVAADLLDFLRDEPENCADLALAADVFVYIGDLAPIFDAVFRVLKPGGLFAFTAQALDAPKNFVLGADLRFAHSPEYLRAKGQDAGFAVEKILAASTRRDHGVDVPGLVAVFAKNAG